MTEALNKVYCNAYKRGKHLSKKLHSGLILDFCIANIWLLKNIFEELERAAATATRNIPSAAEEEVVKLQIFIAATFSDYPITSTVPGAVVVNATIPGD
jgi:hypothetical protein